MTQPPPIPTPDALPDSASPLPNHFLKEIATAQKILLWSVAATVLIFAVPLIALPVWAFQIWSAFNMGKALRLSNVWLWVLGSMVPFIGILFLLRMNATATGALQAAGVRVGLMGANTNDPKLNHEDQTVVK